MQAIDISLHSDEWLICGINYYNCIYKIYIYNKII